MPADSLNEEAPATEAAAEVTELLASARQALAGHLGVPPARATRTAALLGRAALEEIVVSECARLGISAYATMRTRLICMRVLVDAAAGHAACLAWGGLSSACHHHSYELSPTATEIAHLLDLVDRLHRWKHHTGAARSQHDPATGPMPPKASI